MSSHATGLHGVVHKPQYLNVPLLQEYLERNFGLYLLLAVDTDTAARGCWRRRILGGAGVTNARGATTASSRVDLSFAEKPQAGSIHHQLFSSEGERGSTTCREVAPSASYEARLNRLFSFLGGKASQNTNGAARTRNSKLQHADWTPRQTATCTKEGLGLDYSDTRSVVSAPSSASNLIPGTYKLCFTSTPAPGVLRVDRRKQNRSRRVKVPDHSLGRTQKRNVGRGGLRI